MRSNAGRVYDGAMGNYFYRARYYNQSLGRFFSRDPIMNLTSLYSYCRNSPTNFTAPMGMPASGFTHSSTIVAGLHGLIGNDIPQGPPNPGPSIPFPGRRRMTGLPCSSSDPNEDNDGDNTRNGNDPNWKVADEDGDGWCNGYEQWAGTDLDDPDSHPEGWGEGAAEWLYEEMWRVTIWWNSL